MPAIPYRSRAQAKHQRPAFTAKQVAVVRKITKGEIARTADHKQKSTQCDDAVSQNNTQAFNLLAGITAGTGFDNRTGQEINVSGVMLKVRFEKATTVNDLTFRLRVYLDASDTFSTTTTGTSVSAANNVSVGLLTDGTDVTLTPNDKFQVKCLKDVLIDVPGYIGSARNQVSRSYWIPLKRKFVYQPNEVFMRDHNLYCTIGAHSGLGTGTVGDFRAVYSVYFSE